MAIAIVPKDSQQTQQTKPLLVGQGPQPRSQRGRPRPALMLLRPMPLTPLVPLRPVIARTPPSSAPRQKTRILAAILQCGKSSNRAACIQGIANKGPLVIDAALEAVRSKKWFMMKGGCSLIKTVLSRTPSASLKKKILASVMQNLNGQEYIVYLPSRELLKLLVSPAQYKSRIDAISRVKVGRLYRSDNAREFEELSSQIWFLDITNPADIPIIWSAMRRIGLLRPRPGKYHADQSYLYHGISNILANTGSKESIPPLIDILRRVNGASITTLARVFVEKAVVEAFIKLAPAIRSHTVARRWVRRELKRFAGYSHKPYVPDMDRRLSPAEIVRVMRYPNSAEHHELLRLKKLALQALGKI